MRGTLAVGAFLLSLTAVAQTVEIIPPNPDSQTAIAVLIGARGGCVPHDPQVTVAGNVVTIALKFGDLCPAVVAPPGVSV